MNKGDSIEFLMEEIEKIDPHFPKNVQGATQEEIENLQELVGHEFPEIYHSFLHLMGKNHGIEAEGGLWNIAKIIDHFKSSAWRPTKKYTLIGFDSVDTSASYFLDEGTSPAQVLTFFKDKKIPKYKTAYELEAPSFTDFIFRQFFTLQHMKKGPICLQTTAAQAKEGNFEKIMEILQRLDLALHSRSGDGYAYYFSGDFSIILWQPQGYGLGLDFSATDSGKIKSIYQAIDAEVKLVKYFVKGLKE